MLPESNNIGNYFKKLIALIVAEVFIATSLIDPVFAYSLNQKKKSRLAPPMTSAHSSRRNGADGKLNAARRALGAAVMIELAEKVVRTTTDLQQIAEQIRQGIILLKEQNRELDELGFSLVIRNQGYQIFY